MSRFTSWRVGWILGLALVAVIATLGWVVFFSPMLSAKYVEVAGTEQISADQVRDAAKVPTGSAMARLKLDQIATRVESLDVVADADVQREWPNTVRIVITERRPLAVTESTHGYGLVGTDGEIYASVETEPKDLPILAGVTQDSGMLVDTAVSARAVTGRSDVAFTVARFLPRQLRQQVATIDAASPTSVRLTMRSGAIVEWGSVTSSAQKSDVLSALVSRHTAEHYDVSAPDAPAWSS